MKKQIVFYAAIAMLSVQLVGCGKKEAPSETQQPQEPSETTQDTAETMKKEVGEAWSATKDYLAEQKKVLVENSQSQIDALKNRMQELETAARDKGGQAREKYDEYAAEVDAKIDRMQEKLSDVTDAGQEKFQDIKQWMESTLDDTRRAYEAAKQELADGEQPKE